MLCSSRFRESLKAVSVMTAYPAFSSQFAFAKSPKKGIMKMEGQVSGG
jgi:hypothetical protein